MIGQPDIWLTSDWPAWQQREPISSASKWHRWKPMMLLAPGGRRGRGREKDQEQGKYNTTQYPCLAWNNLTLTDVGCLPPTFETFLSPSAVASRALWSCAKLPLAKLPSMPLEARYYHLPLGHTAMQRCEPLMGVLFLRRIYDSLEAQRSSGPLMKPGVMGASGPSVSYNQHIALPSLSLTNTEKCIPKRTRKQDTVKHTQPQTQASESFWWDPYWDRVEGWRRGRGQIINEIKTWQRRTE